MLGRGCIMAGIVGLGVLTIGSIAGRTLTPRAFEQSTQQFNEAAGSTVNLETLEYEAGIVSSRALSRVTHPSLGKTFLIQHQIEHAPWTPIQRRAIVNVTSWVWNEKTEGKQSQEGSDAPIAEFRTRFVLPPRSYTTFQVYPNAIEASRGGSWEEFSGSFESNGKQQRGEMNIVALELGRGAVRAGKLHLGLNGEMQGDHFKVLGFSGSVEDLNGATGKSKQIALSVAERSDGELLAYDVRFDVQGMYSAQAQLDELVVDVAFEHLPGDLREKFKPGSMPETSEIEAVIEEVARNSPALAVRELTVKGIQDQAPIDVHVRGDVSLDGQRFAKSGLNAAAVTDALNADLEIRLSDQCVSEILRKPPGVKRPQNIDVHKMMQVMIQSGYFARDGAYLETKLSMRGIRSAMLNGQSIDLVNDQLAAFLAGEETASSPAEPRESTQQALRDLPNNPELDEMRRQMGLK
jgi:hypothetical protein